VATVALKVMAMVFIPTMTADSAVAPTTSVVYAGVPLSAIGWSNVIVSTDPTAVALVALMATVFGGLLNTLFVRRRVRRADFNSDLDMGSPWLNQLLVVRC
jgi:hypothetical protein